MISKKHSLAAGAATAMIAPLVAAAPASAYDATVCTSSVPKVCSFIGWKKASSFYIDGDEVTTAFVWSEGTRTGTSTRVTPTLYRQGTPVQRFKAKSFYNGSTWREPFCTQLYSGSVPTAIQDYDVPCHTWAPGHQYGLLVEVFDARGNKVLGTRTNLADIGHK